MIRHNNPKRKTYLRRDSGGWIGLQSLPEFFGDTLQDVAPIEEYVKEHGKLFGSSLVARMGAYIVCYSGEAGNRILS